MKRIWIYLIAILLPALLAPEAIATSPTSQTSQTSQTSPDSEKTEQESAKPIKKILFIGDSMTGWMAERLEAYGLENGFEVAAIIWDGSTIAKWGNSPKLSTYISQQNPDAVFISLGLNELLVKNPEKTLAAPVDKILKAVGDRPFLWIGPPSWPGKPGGQTLNDWIEEKVGKQHYYYSGALTLKRQSKTNPHPSREGINKWMDSVAAWIPDHTTLNLNLSDTPTPGKAQRGKTYIYKKMKESL